MLKVTSLRVASSSHAGHLPDNGELKALPVAERPANLAIILMARPNKCL